jgi:hypothetical protein
LFQGFQVSKVSQALKLETSEIFETLLTKILLFGLTAEKKHKKILLKHLPNCSGADFQTVAFLQSYAARFRCGAGGNYVVHQKNVFVKWDNSIKNYLLYKIGFKVSSFKVSGN